MPAFTIMKPILCVTEFTEHTLEAVKAATAIARSWQAKVLLVRSVDEREQFPAPMRRGLVDDDRPRLAQEAEQLRAQGYAVEPHVLAGVPEDGVSSFAQRVEARLVVIGCPPMSRLDTWVLGCTAEQIALTAEAPLLLVRSAAPFSAWVAREKPLTVLAFIEAGGHASAIERTLAELQKIAEEAVDLRECPPDAAQHPREAAARCATAAKDAGADLIVIATHPRRVLPLLHHDTLPGCLLEQAPINVLCVPDISLSEEAQGAATTASERARNG